MKKLLLGAAILAFAFAFAPATASADTGTYRILDYRVKLTPRSDGTVTIAYYQKWLVTGGVIPWITVGTPNADFDLVSAQEGTAVSQVRPANERGWSGVRLDLDRTYRPGQSFEVGFTLRQRGLFWADADSYRLDFTPGWYGAASTDRLAVEVFFFAKTDSVTADPAPARREGQSLFWELRDLRPGQRLRLSIAFPRKLFPAGLKVADRPSAAPAEPEFSFGACFWTAVALLVIFWFAWRIFAGGISSGRYGRGGSISYGGAGGKSSGGGWTGIFTGGGGGFGGRGFSCACACVGCACACACAGGRAAGCDRKLRHSCPLCRTCAVTDCPLHPSRAA